MSDRTVLRPASARKAALAFAGMALALSIVVGITNPRPLHAQAQSAAHPALAAAPMFEVTSVKPNPGCENAKGLPRLSISTSPGSLRVGCQTLDFLIREAYLANGRDPLFISPELYNQSIKGSPAWIKTDRYAIDAKAEGPESRETMLGPMIQALLEDRFKLRVHHENRVVAVYELTVAKGGPKLQASKEADCTAFDAGNEDPLPQGKHYCGVLIRSVNPSVPTALYGATIADFCRSLSRYLGREVIDKTGIAGIFDIRMDVSPADLFPLARMVSSDPNAPATSTNAPGPSIVTAVEKLGLKLESGKGFDDLLVIDHVERPSKN